MVEMQKYNLRHLRAISWVAKLGSIMHVTEKVHISQPAITQGIHSIESWLGALIFERHANGMNMTAEGRLFCDRLNGAFELLECEVARIAPSRHTQIMQQLSASQLRALVAVDAHASFAAAARAMNLAVPSVHRAFKSLEELIGIRLIETTSFGTTTTRAASGFARVARLFFSELTRAKDEVASLRGDEVGRIIIGAMPLVRSHLIPLAVAMFSEAYPKQNITIIAAPYTDLLRRLQNGEVDFLIGAGRGETTVDDIQEQPLFDDPLSIIMSAQHPLMAMKEVTIEHLRSFHWLKPPRASPLYRHYNDLFDGPPPNDAIECNSLAVARGLLINSNRLMLLSDAQIYYEKYYGILGSRPHPSPNIKRLISLTTRRNWRPTKAQQALIDIIKSDVKM